MKTKIQETKSFRSNLRNRRHTQFVDLFGGIAYIHTACSKAAPWKLPMKKKFNATLIFFITFQSRKEFSIITAFIIGIMKQLIKDVKRIRKDVGM